MKYFTKSFETENLIIKPSSMEEQKELWEILRQPVVNRYYFPTPNRIFEKYNLSTDNIDDLIKAREIFQEQLNDWDRQEKYLRKKVDGIINKDNSQLFTWSIFLKDGTVLGQMTVQPKDDCREETRDVGWFIDPDYQRRGYGYETAYTILDFMFNEVGIEEIITSAAVANPGSWRIMEKLGFERTGIHKGTYFDENNKILDNYDYYVNKKMILKK